MDIASAIRHRREQLGLSQSDLARRIETDPSHIAHWESGRRDPSLSNAAAVATALSCSVDALLGRDSSYDAGYRRGWFECREAMKAATRGALTNAA